VQSLLLNTLLPSEILIIDDDTIPLELLTSLTSEAGDKGVPLKYHKKDHTQMRRGLSESKNWAATLATCDIIFYLDDDVVLDREYCAELMKVWEEHEGEEHLIGVGGKISNNRPTGRFEQIYRTLFGLTGECAWDVNSVGFQVWDEGVTDTQKSYYLHGGVSSYRRELINQNPFATFSGGRTGLEDVEHCLRAKIAGYHFYYTPHAHLTHHPAPAGREAIYAAAKKEGINRREIFSRHCDSGSLARFHFAWANVGWIGKKVFSLQLRAAQGLVVGLLK
jgi:cellulose synthase/poly-beta-1,6-N-acetylglucosamine synthase-like glycosyltransferase